ncbi:hypothetical protein ACIBEJ_33650 [Nonomuraea sp. NPDC050790]|uniref:hypothetical protein n=1 Tax=Nonomuraea sp. NPDC050790 TaxID=3364371 RepID=UPI0037968173
MRPSEAAATRVPHGISVATGSLDAPEGLAETLTGIKTVFLVWPFLTTKAAPAVLGTISRVDTIASNILGWAEQIRTTGVVHGPLTRGDGGHRFA